MKQVTDLLTGLDYSSGKKDCLFRIFYSGILLDLIEHCDIVTWFEEKFEICLLSYRDNLCGIQCTQRVYRHSLCRIVIGETQAVTDRKELQDRKPDCDGEYASSLSHRTDVSRGCDAKGSDKLIKWSLEELVILLYVIYFTFIVLPLTSSFW